MWRRTTHCVKTLTPRIFLPGPPALILQELNRGADVAQNLDRIDEVVALVDAATGSRRTAMQLAPAYPIE